MSIIEIGIISSFTLFLALMVVFRLERARGRRFAERMRMYVDVMVLRLVHGVHSVLSYVGTDFIRQIFHYLFHSILRTTLSLMKKGEQKVRTMMRVNKNLAKSAERQSEQRSKLEEIALHKASVALTDDEKKAHRDKTLEGL